VLYSGEAETQVDPLKPTFTHGKSQEEAPPQDVETQTPETPEGEPPQEAYVAKVTFLKSPPRRRVFCWV
jgi:hypothetical protein